MSAGEKKTEITTPEEIKAVKKPLEQGGVPAKGRVLIVSQLPPQGLEEPVELVTPKQRRAAARQSLADKFLDTYGLTGTIVDSYEDFISHTIPDTLRNTVIQTPQGFVHYEFKDLTFLPPRVDGKIIFPREARAQRKAYESQLFIKSIFMTEGEDPLSKRVPDKELKDVFLGNIPVPVGSSRCNTQLLPEEKHRIDAFDPSGYFIAQGGAEKILMNQERAAVDRILCFRKKVKGKDMTQCEMNTEVEGKANTRVVIRYAKAEKKRSIPERLVIIETNCLKTSTTKKSEINMAAIFNILGVKEWRDIISLILMWAPKVYHSKIREFLLPTLAHYETIKKGSIENYITELAEKPKKCRDDLIKTIREQILINNDIGEQRVRLLGLMIYRFIGVEMGFIAPDDRENYANKRLEIAGHLLSHLWRKIFQDLGERLHKEFYEKHATVSDPLDKVKSMTVEAIREGLNKSMNGNKWGHWGSKAPQENITQTHSRLSLSGLISHIKRVIVPIKQKQSPDVSARMMNTSQRGFICTVETPDGKDCGYIKQLSNGCIISSFRDISGLEEWLLEEKKYIPLDEGPQPSKDGEPAFDVPLVLPGRPVGWCQGEKLRDEIVEKRRAGELKIAFDVSVFIIRVRPGKKSGEPDQKELWIMRNPGRLLRPLLIVNQETGKLVVDEKDLRDKPWKEIEREGGVEFLDVEEERAHAMVANFPNVLDEKDPDYEPETPYTHVEVDPALSFGTAASVIPYPTHEMGPRINYQSALEKQTLGIPVASFTSNTYTSLKVGIFSQKPIVTTDIYKRIGYDQYPNGQNLVCAVMPLKAYGKEDAYILKKGALDRGAFATINYKTHRVERKEKQEEITSIIKVGTPLYGGETLVERERREEKESRKKSRKIPTTLEKPEGQKEKKLLGVVDAVLTDSVVRPNVVQVRTSTYKTADIGDKFSSRHAQKGTGGLVVADVDMPFDELTGISPDIIINTHALPSRMTISQLIEMLTGKAAVIRGRRVNATAFRNAGIQEAMDALKAAGFRSDGKHRMRDGVTGRVIDAEIYLGPAYYHSVKHMAGEKIRARAATGKTQPLTRQPVEGRKERGGLQFGYQEGDATMAHGAAYFMRDTKRDMSDPTQYVICLKCRSAATKIDKAFHCDNCVGSEFGVMKVPHSFNVMHGWLRSAHIGLKIEELGFVQEGAQRYADYEETAEEETEEREGAPEGLEETD